MHGYVKGRQVETSIRGYIGVITSQEDWLDAARCQLSKHSLSRECKGRIIQALEAGNQVCGIVNINNDSLYTYYQTYKVGSFGWGFRLLYFVRVHAWSVYGVLDATIAKPGVRLGLGYLY